MGDGGIDNSLDELPSEREIAHSNLERANEQLEVEKQNYDSLQEYGKDVFAVAQIYRDKFFDLYTSRIVKLWFRIRSLFGRKFDIYDRPVPEVIQKHTLINRTNESLVQDIPHLAGKIAGSTGSAFFDTSKKPTVGIITDRFMFHYYQDALDLIYLEPDTYEKAFDAHEFDFILYISCWQGMHYTDDGRVVETDVFGGEQLNQCALEIFRYAKKRGIKVVFQSIEDPVSYDHFLDLAKEADYLFTSASEVVESYKKDTGNDKVFVLEYGVNPHIHNPIGFLAKKTWNDDRLRGGIFFAGSWYPEYERRCEETRLLFDGVIQSNRGQLYVADRNLGEPVHPHRVFPAKYSPFVIPPVEHVLLQKVHKFFDHAINLNTVTDSETMCAMRVFEVPALGSLLISNYARSVVKMAPGVFTVLEPSEIAHILAGYSPREIVNMQIEGIRGVYRDSTVFDCLNFLFNSIDEDFRFASKPVYVISETEEAAQKIVHSQTYSELQALSVEGARKQLPSDGFAVVFGDGAVDENFILDMINAFKFVDVDYVNYVSDDDWAHAYDYVCGTATSTQTLFDLSKVPVNTILDGELTDLEGFALIQEQWGRDTQGTSKDLAVIIPVVKGGTYLEKRCFRSLLRSSAFSRMNIYLVIGDELDAATTEVVQRLSKRFDNVKVVAFEGKKDATVDDMRAFGIARTTERFLAFLDPYNEALNDGYAQLLKRLDGSDVKWAVGYHGPRTGHEGTFEGYPYKVHNIQEYVFKREYLIGNKEAVFGAERDNAWAEFDRVDPEAMRRDMPLHADYSELFEL